MHCEIQVRHVAHIHNTLVTYATVYKSLLIGMYCNSIFLITFVLFFLLGFPVFLPVYSHYKGIIISVYSNNAQDQILEKKWHSCLMQMEDDLKKKKYDLKYRGEWTEVDSHKCVM